MSSQTPEAESTEQALLKVKELIGKSTYKDKLVPLLRAYKRSRSSELLQQGVQQGGYEGSFSKLDDGKSLQQKQKERRQRKAQFLLGDTDDVKGPSVGFSAVPMQGSPPQAVRLGRTCTASMPMPPNRSQGSQVPRVFWAARTHAQLDHAVRELRRTRHRPMMTILASRERFCLHPDIAVAPNKTEACEQGELATITYMLGQGYFCAFPSELHTWVCA
ncbi:hypothetical protein WJX84_003609 [Apatococcus fuscideae]|uniref:RAD3-like helicase DEAD domain-containing protein n=1 Tax=Apatococcus fuscideae TaxID=2026836 RepID=A0AAW1RWX8_9CHLO